MTGQIKPKILFVDDSQHILDAMKRRFASIKSEWDIVFCSSGLNALELMGLDYYRMIFTDLQMPEMDGLELLNIIKDHHPDTTRVIISGNADNEVMLKTYDSVHHFLPKPCYVTTIKNIITNTINDLLPSN